jgi:hypothetical protein
VVFLARSLFRDGTSLHGALLTASLVGLFIMALTRGRPSRMFDPRRPEDSASSDAQAAFRRERRVVRWHQAVFLTVVFFFFFAYAFSGATFLD